MWDPLYWLGTNLATPALLWYSNTPFLPGSVVAAQIKYFHSPFSLNDIVRWSSKTLVTFLPVDEFMKICKKAAKIHGNSFTYTLIESSDIK